MDTCSYTFQQYLVLIRLMVSEKMRFTDGRMDGRTDDGRPRNGISSADSQAKIVNIKKYKILKNGTNDLGIWFIGSVPQNLALIRLIVSEKTGFTDGLRTPAPQNYLC